MSSSQVPESPIPSNWPDKPRFIYFFIPAPVPVGLTDKSSYTLAREEVVDWLRDISPEYLPPGPKGQNWASFQVFRQAEDLTFDLAPFYRACNVYASKTGFIDLVGNDRLKSLLVNLAGDSASTVFSAVTPLIAEKDPSGGISTQLSVSKAFDRCLENLSELYQAYIVQSHDFRVQLPNRRNTFPVIPWTTRDPSDFTAWGSIGVFTPNLGEHTFPQGIGTITDQQLSATMAALSRARRSDPLSVFPIHARSAQRSFFVDGDYSATVVWAHVSMEVFFDSVLLMLAWEEELPAAQASEWFDSGLMKRLRTYYAPRLGGAWDTTNPEALIGRWTEHAHRLRNRVVHQGYLPNEHEAETSMNLSHEVEEYVKSLLINNWKSCPRTMMLTVGVPGLEKRGYWSGELKDYVEAITEEPDWLASLNVWSEQVQRNR